MDFLQWAFWLGVAVVGIYVLALLLSLPYVVYVFLAWREKHSAPVKGHGVKTRFAVLIPARNEGDAVKPLLASLRKVSYPRTRLDVYVITETRTDPVYSYALAQGFFALARNDDTRGVKTKGGALDDAYRQIQKTGRVYDSYAVFDADNVVSPGFFTEMDKLRGQGFRIVVGRRDFTNRAHNWISSCSALMLTFTANYCTAGRKHLAAKGFITGTGYCIDASILAEAGNWPWQGMTEDVELNKFALHRADIRMGFSRFAPFYDEQPEDLVTMHRQHLRWMFGYFGTTFKGPGKRSRIPSLLVAWEDSLWGIPYIASLALGGLALLGLVGIFIAALVVDPVQAMWGLLVLGVFLVLWIREFDGFGLSLSLCDMA